LRRSLIVRVRLEVYRFDPVSDKAPRFHIYELETKPWERVLDCLNRIRWEQDPSLSFRSSCGHGACGADAMRINGFCTLACQKLVKEYEDGIIRVEPLPNFRVIKDLVVDLEPFFQKIQYVKPYLMPDKDQPERERLQSAEQRMKFDEAIRCILCACCTAACPVMERSSDFLGPAALLRAFRYLFDSRDNAFLERMALLDNPLGIWGCKAYGECTKVCPKDIDVRKCLGSIKRKLFETKRKETT